MKNAIGNYEYQYAIADHQGNTRVVFTSATPAAQMVTATFETNNQTTEATQFSNYGHITAGHASTTPGNSQFLNGSSNGGMVGVAKSYKVYPGDQLKIEAYGSYNTPGSSNTYLATYFAGALLNAFALTAPAQGETGTASSAVNTWGGIEAGGWGDGTTDNTDPKAFVNIVLFDKNYKFLDVAYAQLKGSSLYYMTASYTVKEAGYAYLYVSNEQAVQTDVYFDDVKMMYTPTAVVQSNEYYPFGLQTANSWTRDNTTNNFLYDAGSELNSISGMYDLPYRNYDAALGRFFQVDPMATSSHDMTPYHYAGNNPIGANDPTGLVKQYYANPEDDPYNQMLRRQQMNSGSASMWAMDQAVNFSAESIQDGWNFMDEQEARRNAGKASVTTAADGTVTYSFTGAAAQAIFGAYQIGAGITFGFIKGGGAGGKDLFTICLDAVLINNSSSQFKDLQGVANSMAAKIQTAFSGSETIEWKTTANIRAITDNSTLNADDLQNVYRFYLVDDVNKGVENPSYGAVGSTGFGNGYSLLDAQQGGNGIARTAAHEFGHALGLFDIDDEKRPSYVYNVINNTVVGIIKKVTVDSAEAFRNLMQHSFDVNSSGTPMGGAAIMEWQINAIRVRNGMLGPK